MINLPEKFEEFSDTRRQWIIKSKELKEQGKKLAGVFWTFTLVEISMVAGIVQSIANRSSSMLSKIDIVDEVAFTGGVAKSKVLVNMLEKVINKKIYISEDSQIIGALGAAIIGYK